MTRPVQPQKRWIVRCDNYTSGTLYASPEAAEKRKQRIEASGHCPLVHEVVEVIRDAS